ncbi:MAG: hypothetical protein C0402_10605 [Thermodesulfovibrio sp.]|nr:hypothetical protein [Thermodesulfovibrio sp.]
MGSSVSISACRLRNLSRTLKSSGKGTEENTIKKPVVDWDLCIGCGSCVELCPKRQWAVALGSYT